MYSIHSPISGSQTPFRYLQLIIQQQPETKEKDALHRLFMAYSQEYCPSVQRRSFHSNYTSADPFYSFRSITDTGQESLASIAVLSYSGATCAYASATPSSLNRNTSGHVATQAPHEIHPSFTTAFTGHSSLYFLGTHGRQSAFSDRSLSYSIPRSAEYIPPTRSKSKRL